MKKKEIAATLAVLACTATMGACVVACGDGADNKKPPTVYTIVFDTNGGTGIVGQDVTSGKYVTEPADPTKLGYEFDGWYKDEGLTQIWTFEKDKVTGDLTLYAKWKIKPSTSDTYFNYVAVGNTYTVAAKTGQIMPTDVIIPAEHDGKAVTAIADSAFENQTVIKSVFIPSSVKTIGQRAFRGCTNLEQILGADNVEAIGATALGSTKYDTGLSAGAAYIGKTLYKYTGAETTLAVRAGTLGIAAGALQDKDSVTEVTLPDGLKNIGSYAFGGASKGVGITEIAIPDSVVSIGDNAFRNAKSLSKIYIGTGAENIGSNVFAGTAAADVTYNAVNATVGELFKGLTAEAALTVGNDVTELPVGLVKEWTGLKTVVIGSGVTAVPDSMFAGLVDLKTVTLGVNTETIGNYAFRGSGITEIAIPEKVSKIGTGAFVSCAALTEAEYNAADAEGTPENGLAFTGCSALVKVTVGDNVTAIPAYLFMNTASLKTLKLGAKVETIGVKAFYGTGLTALELPGSLISVGESAFEGASYTALTLPAGLETVGAKAFAGNTALKSVTLNSAAAVQEGGTGMFDGCTSIDSFAVGADVTAIPAYILQGNTKITAVTLGEKVTAVGDHAFDGCTALATVEGSEQLTNIGTAAFNGTPWFAAELNKNGAVFVGTALVKWNGALPAALEIPEKTTSIAADAFASATGKESVTALTFAGVKIESIGDNVFNGFTGITTVTIPASVEIIGNSAFAECTELTSVVFEENSKLDTVGNRAFYKDNKLKDITFPDSMTSIGNNALYGVGGNVVLGMGCTSLGDRLFSTVSGDPVAAYNNIVSVEIKGAVTKIPAGFLDGIGNVKTVILPSTVREIGARAFYGCAELTELDLSGVVSIGVSAFEICTKLADTDLNPAVTEIGNYAFKQSGVTGKLVFDELVTLSDRVFESTKVTEVVFKKAVDIGASAFVGCSMLSKVDLGSCVQVIRGSFGGCTLLKEITLPASLKQIDRSSFDNAIKVYLDGFVNPTEVKTDSFKSDALFLCKHENYADIVADNSGWAVGAGAKWAQWKERFVDESLYFVENGWTVINGKILDYAPTVDYASVVIPKAVTQLESVITVFKSVENLAKCTSLSVQEGSTAFKIQNGALVSADGTRLYYYIGGADTLSWNDVTTVTGYAFYNKITEEKTLSLPKLSSVGSYAFYGCSGLKTFDFGKISEIPDYAFYGTGFTSLLLQQSSIGKYAFANCAEVIGINLTGVSSIGNYAFQKCPKLENVEIVGTIKKLPDYVFSDCSKLSQVNLPDGITEFGRNVFSDCTEITTFKFPSKLSILGIQAFSGTGFESIVIPASVETVAFRAFAYCENLRSVEFEEGSQLTSIDSNAFTQSSLLNRIVLPDTLTEVSHKLFVGDNVRVVDTYATKFTRENTTMFYSEPIAKLILRGNSVADISNVPHDKAFSKADALFKIYVKDSLVDAYKTHADWSRWAHRIMPLSSLDNNDAPEIVTGSKWTVDENGVATAYEGDLNNILITANVKSFGNSANGIWGIFGVDIVFLENVTFTVEEGNTAFKVDQNGALLSADGTVLYAYPTSGTAESYTSETVTSVKGYAFANAKKLTSVVLPNVTRIESYAFYGCAVTATVDIGDKLTALDQNALCGIKSDAIIYVRTTAVPTAGASVFDSDFNGKIYVPQDSVEAYKTAEGWSAYAAMIELVPYEVTIGDWTMWNDGRFISYAGTFSYDGTETVTIPKELTSLPDSIAKDILKVFSDVTANRSKVKITVEAGSRSFKVENGLLMSLDEKTVYACADYAAVTGQTLTLENAVTIKVAAFALSGIVGINLPNVESIEYQAFYKATALTTVNLGSKFKYIEGSVFSMANKSMVITVLAETPPEKTDSGTTFLPIGFVGKIYVPSASVEAYKAATGWNKAATKIEAISQ